MSVYAKYILLKIVYSDIYYDINKTCNVKGKGVLVGTMYIDRDYYNNPYIQAIIFENEYLGLEEDKISIDINNDIEGGNNE